MTVRRKTCWLVAAAFLAATGAHAFEVAPVTIDVAPGTASSSPGELTLGARASGAEVLYFAATIAGTPQVWATDGSAAGTVLIGGRGPGRIVPTPWGSVLFLGPWPGEGNELLEGEPGVAPRLRHVFVPGTGEPSGYRVTRVPFHGRIVIGTPQGQGIALGPGDSEGDLGAIGLEFSSDAGILASSTPTGPSYQLRRALAGGWTAVPQEPPVANSAFQMITTFGDRACGKVHAIDFGGSLYCADPATGLMRRVTDASGNGPGLRDGTPYLRVGDRIVFTGADRRLWSADGTMTGLRVLSAENDIECIAAGGGTRVIEFTSTGTRWRDVAEGRSGALPNGWSGFSNCSSSGDSSGYVPTHARARWRNVTALVGQGMLVLFDGAEAFEVTAPGITWANTNPSFVGDRLVVVGTDAASGTEPRVIDLRLFDDSLEN